MGRPKKEVENNNSDLVRIERVSGNKLNRPVELNDEIRQRLLNYEIVEIEKEIADKIIGVRIVTDNVTNEIVDEEIS